MSKKFEVVLEPEKDKETGVGSITLDDVEVPYSPDDTSEDFEKYVKGALANDLVAGGAKKGNIESLLKNYKITKITPK